MQLLFQPTASLPMCQWLMDQVPLGNKTPRPGYARQIWCPACCGLLQYPLALNSGHVLVESMVVEGICFSFWRIFYQLSRYENPRRSPGFPQWMCWGWKEWEDCPLSLCEWDGLQGCEIVSPGSPAERSKPLKTHGHVVEHVGGRGGERWLKSFCNLEMFTSIWTIYDEKLHWLLPFGNCKVFHTSLVCRVVLKVVSDSYPPRVEFQWYNKSGILVFYQNLLYNEIWTSLYIPKYQVTNWPLVTLCCFKDSKSPF